MTTNITTLAVNLLISERIGHRDNLGRRIIELIRDVNDQTPAERQLKDSFITVIAKCVENPVCESRDVLYQLAEFYNQKISGDQKVTAAA